MPVFDPGYVINHYRFLRVIGEGGMGCVYEAVDIRLNRRVAIKVLHPALSADHSIIRRFHDEAWVTAQIDHPGIVQVYDVGQQPDGSSYLVMEFLEGETLAGRLRREPNAPFSLQQKLRIGWQVSSAMAAAHARGIVHRDVKPGNIFLVHDLDMPEAVRARVLDFGIAKLTHQTSKTSAGVFMGTPMYMAPEQCRDSASVTDRADVYALGVVLFETLTGRPPFDSEGIYELIGQKLVQSPPKLSEVAPALEKELLSLVDSMLAREPQDRPAMLQVASTLRRLSESERPRPHLRPVTLLALSPAGGGSSGFVGWRKQLLLGTLAIVASGFYFSLFGMRNGALGVKLYAFALFSGASWGASNLAWAIAQGGISFLRSAIQKFESRSVPESLAQELDPAALAAPYGLPSYPSPVPGLGSGDSQPDRELPAAQDFSVSVPGSLQDFASSLSSSPNLSPGPPNLSPSPPPSLPSSWPSLPSAQTLPELTVGDRVQQFELVDLILDSEINRVFLARSDIHYKVAIHVLKRRYDGRLDQDAAKRFLNSARALEVLNRIQHQNLPCFICVDQRADGTPFLITEYYAGETLREHLSRGAALAQGEVIDVALQLAHALYICHEQGVVHRALTPDAVLFRHHLGAASALYAVRQVKLLGFSMVKLLDGHQIPKAEHVHTQHGQQVGVKLYMAPEQAAAEPNIDGRADVFVLGMLLFEMLTGVPACVAPKGARAVSIYATRDEFPLFAEPDGPLQDVIRQMTKRNPISRLTMKEVYERLLAIRSAPSVSDGFPSVPIGSMSLIGLSRKLRIQMPNGAAPESPKPPPPRTVAPVPPSAEVAVHVARPSLVTPSIAPPVTSRTEDVTLAEGLSLQEIRNNLLKMPDGEFDSLYLIWFRNTQTLVGSQLDKNSRINHLLLRHEPAEIVERLHLFRSGGCAKTG